MKKIYIILFLIISQTSFSQERDNIKTYKANGLYIEFFNENGDKVAKKPLGKEVSVSVDTFFKKYSIKYTDEDNVPSIIVFKYVNDAKNGFKKMKDDNGNLYLLSDNLEAKNKLLIISSKKSNGLLTYLFIE